MTRASMASLLFRAGTYGECARVLHLSGRIRFKRACCQIELYRVGDELENNCREFYLASIFGRDSFTRVGGQCSSVVEQRFRKP
jgi:hypothetical protein